MDVHVVADKGFNFSHFDGCFVNQKKNHFQVSRVVCLARKMEMVQLLGSGVGAYRSQRRPPTAVCESGRTDEVGQRISTRILRSEIGNALVDDHDQTVADRPQTRATRTRPVRFLSPR